MTRSYWLDLFTIETWQEFRDHGGLVSGFSEARLATVKRMRPGDYLLCYLTRASRWVGVLEVTGEAYFDESRIWKSQVFLSRIPVRPVVALSPEYGVPVLDMRDELTVFQGLDNPNRWSGPFRGSPAKWKSSDGEAILRALQQAEAEHSRGRWESSGGETRRLSPPPNQRTRCRHPMTNQSQRQSRKAPATRRCSTS